MQFRKGFLIILNYLLLSHGPPKNHLAASTVSVMNPNQDNMVICRKPYLNYPRLKYAKTFM